jgi:hypothetical protein
MKAWDIVGFTYDADVHCVECTAARFGAKLEDANDPPVDSEGNELHPIFASDEGSPEGEVCADCGAEITEPYDDADDEADDADDDDDDDGEYADNPPPKDIRGRAAILRRHYGLKRAVTDAEVEAEVQNLLRKQRRDGVIADDSQRRLFYALGLDQYDKNPPRLSFRVGQRVRVVEGAGLDSGKVGVVISPREIPVDGRGIPKIPGHYKPVDWKREVAVRYDDGTRDTMFKVALRPVAAENPRRTRKPQVWAGERDEFFVDVWQERDRLHIALMFDPEHGRRRRDQRSTGDGELAAEWWDDDAVQMFEDGFFESGRKLEQSVVDYAVHLGLVKLT